MINVRMQNKETVRKLTPHITVVGVGGAGGNAVNNMISAGLQGCEFVVCNTDAQALGGTLSDVKIQLGVTVTGGLGAGAKPEIGRAAAEESLDDVMQHLEGANMAFITAGMGGGTGTGAAPVIARACREKGILTVGVVTKPFHFEGTTRMRMAEEGIREMQDYVDTLIVIPNQNLFRIANEKTTFAEAFRMADSVLQSGVRGVTDLMVMPGLINLDFADIRSVMLEMGKAMMGTGEATGDRRALEAAEAAINNPLLDDVSMKGARGVIINVTGGMDMTLFEVDEACNRIRDEVDPNANIIFGSTFDERLEGIVRVSVVATGIDVAEQKGRFTVPKAGHSLINAITGSQQQERKFDRVQPQTVTGSAPVETSVPAAEIPATVPVAASVAAAAPAPAPFSYTPVSAVRAAVMNAPIAPPVPHRHATYAEPRRTEDLRVSAPVQQQQTAYQQQAVYHQQPVYQPAAAVTEPVSPRAYVHENAFIPPQPVEAPVQGGGQVSSPSLGGGLVAARQTVTEAVAVQTMTGPALNLRPPVPGAQTVQKKRAPTLFERFTGPLWGNHGGQDQQAEAGQPAAPAPQQAGSEQATAAAPSASTVSPAPAPGGLRAPLRPGQQGSLNIDAPASEGTESELDIPAFLRRQAN